MRDVIAIIGAGNGGQAMAGHFSAMGYQVRVYDRNEQRVKELNLTKRLNLTGALELSGQIEFASTDLAQVIAGAELIMVTTTATAHREIASKLASALVDNQIIVLNPGRTCGALEFRNTLQESGLNKRVYVAEAQTLVYACRLIQTGLVNVIGVKDTVFFSAYPASDTQAVYKCINSILPCFKPAANVLQTSFENVGAVFHPAVVLFNEAAIERGDVFYFYRDMTKGLAKLIETIDNERLSVAKAYGLNPISAFEWVSYAYGGVAGDTLCERMQNNPAYYEILAPTTIECRQITEDIPTGLIPISELGKAAGISTPVMDSVTTMCSHLLGRDFMSEGRTLQRLGLSGLTAKEIIGKVY